jgi:hypothetical protein
VVDSLRSRLKDATQEFKEVLTTRTDSLRAHQERKSMFSAAPEGGGAGGAGRQPLFSQPGASFLPANARNPLAAGVRGGLQGGSSGGGGGEQAPLLGGQQQQSQQQSQALMLPQQDQYLSSRADALNQVESTIVELGSIFQQLAHMVGGWGWLEGRGWVGAVGQGHWLSDGFIGPQAASSLVLRVLHLACPKQKLPTEAKRPLNPACCTPDLPPLCPHPLARPSSPAGPRAG